MSKKKKFLFASLVTLIVLGLSIVVLKSYKSSDPFGASGDWSIVNQSASFKMKPKNANHFDKNMDHEEIKKLLKKMGATDYQFAINNSEEIIKIKTDIPFVENQLNKQIVEIEKNLIPLLLSKETGYFRFDQILDNAIYFAEFKNGNKIKGSFIKAQIESKPLIISVIEPLYAPVIEH